MSKEPLIQVRDRRKTGYFTIDNEILDDFPTLGPYGILVYAALARFSDNGSQSCRITLKTISERARISRSSSCRGVAELESANLLRVERAQDQTSTYTLLEVPRTVSYRNGSVPIETEPFLSDTHIKTINKKTLNKTTTEFVLPEWIDSVKWKNFEDMRRGLKKPLSDAAREIAVKKLFKLESQGMRHEDVLDQSVMNSWQGLFEVTGGSNGTTKADQKYSRMVNTGREVVAGILGLDSNGTHQDRSDGGAGGKQGAPTIDGRVHTRQRSRALSDGESLFESSD